MSGGDQAELVICDPPIDITYIPTREGWVDLAAVEDLFGRRVVGWAMSGHPDAELVSRAFRNALARRVRPKSVRVHADRGCQYTSTDYQPWLTAAEAVVSFSRKGNCWDKAPPLPRSHFR